MRLAFVSLMFLALAACGDPLAEVPTLAEVEVAAETGQADALPDAEETSLAEVAPVPVAEVEKPRRGLLGFLRRRADDGQSPAADAGTPPETPASVEAPASDAPPEAPPVASAPESPETQLAAMSPPVDPVRKGGFLGGLFRGGNGASDRGAAEPAVANPSRGPKPGAPDYEQVGPGVTLPHGKVARLCGVPIRKLGKKSESFPRKGGRYTLYDSAPGSTAPRSFYLTGFDDGCARQFTAALVIFGSVESYEQIHYGTPSQTQPRSATDQAYEALKSRVCRVGKGKPCGAKISKLSRNTGFLSVYERFGGNPRWSTLLVHDGALLAVDTKG